jgi:exopolysaccharide biosynthesis polyprenyl glycosylphosphotransferase
VCPELPAAVEIPQEPVQAGASVFATEVAQERRAVALRRATLTSFRRLSYAVAATDALSVLPASLPLSLARAPLAVVALFARLKLYDIRNLESAEEIRRVFLGISVVIVGIPTVFLWIHRDHFSRAWVAITWGLSVGLVLVTRRVWHMVVRRARARGYLTLRTVVVGTSAEAAHLVRVLRSKPLGYEPIGLVSAAGPNGKRSDLPILGSLSDLEPILARTQADCVFVVSGAVGEDELAHMTRLARVSGIELRVASSIPQLRISRISMQPIGGFVSLCVRRVELTKTAAITKRVLDVVGATLILIITAPLWAVISIAIVVSSRGPVLYRSVRVGRRGTLFTMFKFRTMVENAEGLRLDLEAQNEASGPLFKIRRDPRCTPVGRLLRRMSLDELPQLLNVVRGEMSLVGPRPPLPSEVEHYQEWHHQRLEVRPGMTGLWQVSGRSELSFDDYVRLDVYYVENWSLAYDVFILAKTIPVLLRRRGAY